MFTKTRNINEAVKKSNIGQEVWWAIHHGMHASTILSFLQHSFENWVQKQFIDL
jgi:hypothetical protein